MKISPGSPKPQSVRVETRHQTIIQPPVHKEHKSREKYTSQWHHNRLICTYKNNESVLLHSKFPRAHTLWTGYVVSPNRTVIHTRIFIETSIGA